MKLHPRKVARRQRSPLLAGPVALFAVALTLSSCTVVALEPPGIPRSNEIIIPSYNPTVVDNTGACHQAAARVTSTEPGRIELTDVQTTFNGNVGYHMEPTAPTLTPDVGPGDWAAGDDIITALKKASDYSWSAPPDQTKAVEGLVMSGSNYKKGELVAYAGVIHVNVSFEVSCEGEDQPRNFVLNTWSDVGEGVIDCKVAIAQNSAPAWALEAYNSYCPNGLNPVQILGS